MIVLHLLAFLALVVFIAFGAAALGRMVLEETPKREQRRLARVRALIEECPPDADSFVFHGFPATLHHSASNLTLTVDLSSVLPSSVKLTGESGDRVLVFDPHIDTELCIRGRRDEVYSIMNESVRAELKGLSALWPHFPRLEQRCLVCNFDAHDVARGPTKLRAARRLVSALGTLVEGGVPERLLRNYEHDQNFELGRASLRALLEHHKDTPAAQRAHALALSRRDIAPVGDEVGRLSVVADGDEAGRLALSRESGALGLTSGEEGDDERS